MPLGIVSYVVLHFDLLFRYSDYTAFHDKSINEGWSTEKIGSSSHEQPNIIFNRRIIFRTQMFA